MTVSSTTNKSGPYLGNGSTVEFDYEFRILDPSHLTVIMTEGGIDTPVAPSDFTVSGVGASGGGALTFLVAPATGQSITIIRNAPFTQPTDLENQGAYYAETVEGALDLGVMRDQQLAEGLSRAVQIPIGADPSALGGLIEDIIRLGDSADEIDIVAGIAANVTTVAGIFANVTTVAGIAANVSTVAGVAANVTTVATNIAAVNTAATNIGDIIAAPGHAAAAIAAEDGSEAARDAAVVAKNAAEAAASTVNLPVPVANTFLQRNAGNTAYVAKTAAETRDALDLDFHGNVKWSGAVGDGAANDAAVFQAAATAGGVWEVPSGNYKLDSTITAGQPVYWEGGKVLNGAGNAPISLPGVQELWFQGGKFFYEPKATENAHETVRIDRVADYTGGNPSFVAAGLKVNHIVSAGVADIQWAILGMMDNSATGGENAGLYGQGLKRSGAGPTWGIVADVKDYGVDPTTGAVSVEAGIFVNGTDANQSRIGVHIPLHRRDPAGATGIVTRALWLNPNANTQYTKGVQFSGAGSFISGISFENTMTRAINFDAAATVSIGIDFSAASFSNAPIRMATNQKIQLEATGAITFGHETGKFAFKTSGTELLAIDTTTGAISIAGTKVVGPRETGWTAGTGTALKGAFAAYAGVTHTGAYVQSTIQALDDATRNASQRVRAIEAALRTHGLIN